MSNERIQPHSIDAEKSVLGSLMVDDSAITKVVDVLKADSFYKPAHKSIYKVAVGLFSDNEPIDIVTVSQRLSDAGRLDSVGGRAYINDLAMDVISSAGIEYHARIVAQKSLLRELIKTGSKIINKAYDEPDADVVTDEVEQMVFDVCQRKDSKKTSVVGEIVNDSFNLIQERFEKKGELAGLPSGFYDLDVLTSGFQKSDLIIVAARPSMGKTAFCLNIAQEVGIRKNVPVAVFSLEMSKEQLVTRMMCSEAEIDSARVRTGQLADPDWNKLAGTIGDLSDVPIYIDDTAGATVMDIRAKCRRMCSGGKELGLVIIDYLQLMESDSGKNREQEISKISRGLKSLAREFDVPVIALSQLSRAVESRQCKRPMLSDLRESGAIEQDADIVMFLYREEYYDPENIEKKDKADVIIAKQRNGPTGDVELIFQKNITKFKNPVKKGGSW